MALDPTAAEFRAAALELKAAEQSLMPLARRNIRAATAPAAEAVRRSAMETLPHTGGLNQWVADASVKTGILTGPRTAGVRIVARKTGHDLPAVEAGTVRHPVYGHRNAWAETQVRPGFFSTPLQELAPAVELACMAVMTEASRVAGFH